MFDNFLCPLFSLRPDTTPGRSKQAPLGNPCPILEWIFGFHKEKNPSLSLYLHCQHCSPTHSFTRCILHPGSVSPILFPHDCQRVLPKCQGLRQRPIAFRTESPLLCNTLARPQGRWHNFQPDSSPLPLGPSYASFIPHTCPAPTSLHTSPRYSSCGLCHSLFLAPCCPSRLANVNSSIGWQLRVNSSKDFCSSWPSGLAPDPTVLGRSPLLAPDTLH